MQVGLRPRLRARPSLVDLLVQGPRNRTVVDFHSDEGSHDVEAASASTSASSPPPSPPPAPARFSAPLVSQELEPAANLPLPSSPASTASLPLTPLLLSSLPRPLDSSAASLQSQITVSESSPTSPAIHPPASVPESIPSPIMAPVSLHPTPFEATL